MPSRQISNLRRVLREVTEERDTLKEETSVWRSTLSRMEQANGMLEKQVEQLTANLSRARQDLQAAEHRAAANSVATNGGVTSVPNSPQSPPSQATTKLAPTPSSSTAVVA
ncbi:MAG: hypothetical protein ACK41O_26470, partial [Runella zeae]